MMPKTPRAALPTDQGEGAAMAEAAAAKTRRRLDKALISAVIDGDARLCAALIAQGASANAKLAPKEAARLLGYPSSHTALTLAVTQSRSDDVARVLLAAGADPNAQRDGTWSALGFAMHNHPGCVDALLDAGASPRHREGQPWDCPSLCAVHHGNIEAFERLARMGGNAAPRHHGSGHSAAMEAVMWGQLAMLAHLLARGGWEDLAMASPPAEIINGEAPVRDALSLADHRNGSWESKAMAPIAKRLIECARSLGTHAAAPSPEAPGYAGLHLAAEAGGFDLVKESAAAFASHSIPLGPQTDKRVQWMELLLRTHPRWRLAPEEAAASARLFAAPGMDMDGQARLMRQMEERLALGQITPQPSGAKAASTLRI